MNAQNWSERHFYVGAPRTGGRRPRLLLGPFAEPGVAASAMEAARELHYLTSPRPGPVPLEVEVVTLDVPCGTRPPAGDLNAVAVAQVALTGP